MVLALDQGTTSSRAILFRDDGTVARVARREFAQHYPRPGWVEHDPEEILATQLAVAREALAGERAEAIGITNQRETTVVWERATGKAIAPAIVWQDRRTADKCARLRASGKGAEIAAITGLEVDAYFSATKVEWILDNVPGARARAERGELAFGTVDAWLLWHLTGGRHATDVTNASRTMLFDICKMDWDERLLELFRIPRAVLPEVLPSGADFGDARALGQRLPVRAMAGDQQAALEGHGCNRPGLAKNTYGTGCFLLVHTGRAPVRSANRLLATVTAAREGVPPGYALEGSVFSAGAAVGWLRDGLGIIGNPQEVEVLAAAVPDTAGVHLVPAFAGLGAPHWDPEARGLLCGLTRGTSKAHVARAALEGVAFQVVEVLEAMASDAPSTVRELRVDGGASRNNLLMQFQADIARVPVIRPVHEEVTALGAARLAGLGVGEPAPERVFVPQMSEDEAAERLREWKRAVRRCLGA